MPPTLELSAPPIISPQSVAEVVRLVARGDDPQAVAARLGLSSYVVRIITGESTCDRCHRVRPDVVLLAAGTRLERQLCARCRR